MAYEEYSIIPRWYYRYTFLDLSNLGKPQPIVKNRAQV